MGGPSPALAPAALVFGVVRVPGPALLLVQLHLYIVDRTEVRHALVHRRRVVLLGAELLPLRLPGLLRRRGVLLEHRGEALQQPGLVAVAQGQLDIASLDQEPHVGAGGCLWQGRSLGLAGGGLRRGHHVDQVPGVVRVEVLDGWGLRLRQELQGLALEQDRQHMCTAASRVKVRPIAITGSVDTMRIAALRLARHFPVAVIRFEHLSGLDERQGFREAPMGVSGQLLEGQLIGLVQRGGAGQLVSGFQLCYRTHLRDPSLRLQIDCVEPTGCVTT